MNREIAGAALARHLPHITVSEQGCWEWSGATDGRGYGQLGVQRRTCRAHRVSYLVFIGPIPEGMYVCHYCDNRPCINPSHLFLGTPRDNVRDCMAKGRLRPGALFGEAHPKVTTPAADVATARRMATQGASQRSIAARFGVSQSTVYRWVHSEVRGSG